MGKINIKGRQTAGNEKQQMLQAQQKKKDEEKAKKDKQSQPKDSSSSNSGKTVPKVYKAQDTKQTKQKKSKYYKTTNYTANNASNRNGSSPKSMQVTASNTNKEKKVSAKKAEEVKANLQNKYGNNKVNTQQSDVIDEIKGGVASRLGSYGAAFTDKESRREVVDRFLDVIPDGGAVKTGAAVARAARDYIDTKTDKVSNLEKKANKKSQALADKGDELQQNAVKGKTGLKKDALNAVGQTAGMLTDMVAGAGQAWMIPMFASSYQSDYNSMKKQGYTEDQSRKHAKMSADVEVLTETLGSSALGLPVSALGRGGSKLTRGILDTIPAAKGLSQASRNILGATMNLVSSGAEEAGEEFVGGILQPIVDYTAYGRDQIKEQKQQYSKYVTQLDNGLENNVSKLVAQGYSRAEAQQLLSNNINDDYVQSIADDLVKNGMPKENAKSIANMMAMQQQAYLAGDEKTAEAIKSRISKDMYKMNPVELGVDWTSTWDAMKSAFLSVGMMGAGTAIANNSRGAAIKAELDNQFDGEGSLNLAKMAVSVDDKANASRAQSIVDHLSKGEGRDLSNQQVLELYEMVDEQNQIDTSKMQASRIVAMKQMVYEDGTPKYVVPAGEVTAKKLNETEAKLNAALANVELDETEADMVWVATLDFESGNTTVSDVNALTNNHPIARAVFEEVTGVKLAENNADMKDQLFALSANNYVALAAEETKDTIDQVNGAVIESFNRRMGTTGQTALANVIEISNDLNSTIANEQKMEAFFKFYSIGARADMSIEDAVKIDNPIYDVLSEEEKRQAYEAGQWDVVLATDPMYGVTVQAGQTLKAPNLDNTKKANIGNVRNESNVGVRLSMQEALRTFAKASNIEIVLFDGKPGVNGAMRGSIMYLNANLLDTDVESMFAYTIMHEMTHHIKLVNPQDYATLERRLFEAVEKKHGKDYVNQLMDKYREVYKGQELDDAGIREEIVADAAREFLADPEFIDNMVATEDVGFIRSILNAIRTALEKIRELLSINVDENINNGLITQLDEFKELERLWLDAYHKAVVNSANNRSGEFFADDSGIIKMSIVTDKNTIKDLDSQEHTKTYRAMVLRDGKLYPPMSTQVKDESGEKSLREGISLGDWVEAEPTTDSKMFNEEGKFHLIKDEGTPMWVAYNPFIHSSNSPMNDQFTSYWKRENLVVVEGNIPNDELVSGERATTTLDDGRTITSKDTTGIVHNWNAGSVYNQITEKTGERRTVYLTNHFQPTRIVPDSEIAKFIYEKTNPLGIAIPYNVVSRGTYDELKKMGAIFAEPTNDSYPSLANYDSQAKFSISPEQDAAYMDAVNNGDMDTAQRMVDEAAARAGYTTLVYRGTNDKQPNVFGDYNSEYKSGSLIKGFFSDLEPYARTYGENTKPYYINSSNFLEIPRAYGKEDMAAELEKGGVTGVAFNEFINDEAVNTWKETVGDVLDPWEFFIHDGGDITQKVAEAGYDGIWWYEGDATYDGYIVDDGVTYMPFYSNNIKSADPVVCDNVGNVIPLSQRFNSKSNDIRYSISQEASTELDKKGVKVTDGGSVIKYSHDSWSSTDIEHLTNLLIKAGYSETEVSKWINNVDSIAAIIGSNMAKLNYTADRFQDALKNNEEYFYTLDLSTLCQKRRLYQGTYNAIMKQLGNVGLYPADTIRLRQLMDKYGYQTPCGICYEESRKKNEGKFAETWLFGMTDEDWAAKQKKYESDLKRYEQGKRKKPEKPVRYLGYKNMEHEDPYIPTINQVTTTDGRDWLKENHPEAWKDYLDYQKGRGSANPKVSFTHTDYRGDILRLTDKDIEKVKHIGGLRIQSFSDFEIVHVIDMMQAVMDMAARKLTAQAYSKVPAFADIFGGTGIKINLSLIGHVVDGELKFDAKEGIDSEEAFRIRKKYPEDVGTILVGANTESILKAWADPRIDMVIPFHRSGWSEEEFAALGLGGYEDFEPYQTEKYIGGGEVVSLKDAKKGSIYSADYWKPELSGKENAERYLQKCAELQYRPVFYNFLHDNGDGTWSLQEDGSTDGYWKSLVDYKMYPTDEVGNIDETRGKDAKQQVVRPIFDMDVAQDVMEEYAKGDELPDVLPVAEDVVQRFVKEMQLPRSDREYFSAIDANNTPLLEKMVKKAMDNAGYKTQAFHGTTADFDVFDNRNNFGDAKLPGWTWVAAKEEYTDAFRGRSEDYKVVSGAINKGEVLNVGNIEQTAVKWKNGNRTFTNAFEKLAEKVGTTTQELYDAVNEDYEGNLDDYFVDYFSGDSSGAAPLWAITRSGAFKKLVNDAGYDTIEAKEGANKTKTFGLSSSRQFKRNDLVLRDNKGEIIPLSQRFNSSNDSIKYSYAGISSNTANMDTLTEATRLIKTGADADAVRMPGGTHWNDNQWPPTVNEAISNYEDDPKMLNWHQEDAADSIIDRLNDADIRFSVSPMNVLVACEESQAVCKELRRLGHNAYSCDIQEQSGGRPEWHIKGDVSMLLNGNCDFTLEDGTTGRQNGKWDMIIAFPPCTHLATSGAKHFEKKKADGRQREAIEFFCSFFDADCDKLVVENPRNIIGGDYIAKWYPDILEKYGSLKRTQEIQPWMFGDDYSKATCLWLRGVPELSPAVTQEPEIVSNARDKNGVPLWYNKANQKERSKTFPGIANAMAETWAGQADTIKYSKDMPSEDDVFNWMADHADEIGIPNDLDPNDRMMMESRARRLHIREELEAFAKKNYKPTVLTKDKVLDRNSVKQDARELVMALMQHSVYDGKYKTKDVKLAIDGISKMFPLCKEEKWYEVMDIAYDVAAEIVEDIEYVDDEKYAYYKEVRDYFGNTRIGVSERTKSEFGDDWDRFRRSLMGKVMLVNSRHDDIDRWYEDIVEKFGTLVDAEPSTPAEMLVEIASLFDKFADYRLAYSSAEMQQVIWDTASDLIDIAENAEAWHSFADKKKAQYEEKTRKLKERQAEAMRKEKALSAKKVVRANAKSQNKINKLNDKVQRLSEKVKEERWLANERVANANFWAEIKAQIKERKYQAKEEKRKTAQEMAKSYGNIEDNYKWLTDRLVKPTDDKHIPAGFRTELAHLLQQLDLQTARSKSLEEKYGPAQKTLKMAALRRQLEEVEKEDDSGIFEYDGQVFEIMKALEIKLDGRPIRDLELSDLKQIDILLNAIRHNIANVNQAFADGQKETISRLADTTIVRCKDINERRGGNRAEWSGFLGRMDKLLNEDEVTPIDMFERFGGGIESCYKELRKGFDNHVRNIEYFRELAKEVLGDFNNKGISRLPFLNLIGRFGSEIEQWRDDSQAQVFELESGESVKLNPAQVMSLYCLSKREQALGHIFGSGIVASSISSHSKFKEAIGAKRELQTTTAQVTYADVQKILSTLTPEQKKIADRMQHELNTTFRDWGNETSLQLNGYRKFTEENYFPIQSSAYYLESNFDNNDVTERIRNFGFTKGTVVKANNPIVIDDFFDVIVDHVNKMSLYNSFACPIADFQRVYNYNIRNEEGLITSSVKDQLAGTFGSGANRYIKAFMKDLNGSTTTRPTGTGAILSRSFGLYKKAAIGGNIRVGLQQPTAIVRAFDVIAPKYFVGGSINFVGNMKEMIKYCPIATWKARGNYQIDMARNLDDIMMNNEQSLFDTLFMGGYGLLDNLTWGSIWNAVKNEVKDKHRDVEVGSQEFWDLCNERASEVFDKTQVVDSVFHRSSLMRSQDFVHKLMTSFMAEPTRTFNMVRTDLLLAREMRINGNKAGYAKKVAKCITVFALNAAAVSAAAAIADALRGRGNDDDDNKNLQELWLLNFLANLGDNLNLLNNVYVVKDILSLKDGYGTSFMPLEGWESLMTNINDWEEFAKGESKKEPGELVRAFAEAVGYVTGQPVKNVLRDTEAIFCIFGLDVFAADGTIETTSVKWIENNSGIDNLLNRFGINLTEEEKKQRRIDGLVSDIESKAKGLTGSDRDQAAWEAISEGYTKKIEECDLESIEEMRKALAQAGVDTYKTDEKIIKALSSSYKKTIGDSTKSSNQYKLREYMLELGVTETQISNICYQSDTARDLKAAMRMWDEEAIVEELTVLRKAGISVEDIYKLYDNRNRGASTYHGKYATSSSTNSTGTYVWPTQGTITSGYGNRTAPTSGASTYHEAIDIGATQGTKVVAADGGVVVSSGWNSGYGYQVVVRHSDGTETYYSHLYCYHVLPGDKVSKGQQIGQVGSTGTSTGSHLDFRVKANGKFVDPMSYLS